MVKNCQAGVNFQAKAMVLGEQVIRLGQLGCRILKENPASSVFCALSVRAAAGSPRWVSLCVFVNPSH
jgi:hypothetical protein